MLNHNDSFSINIAIFPDATNWAPTIKELARVDIFQWDTWALTYREMKRLGLEKEKSGRVFF